MLNFSYFEGNIIIFTALFNNFIFFLILKLIIVISEIFGSCSELLLKVIISSNWDS